MITFCCVISDNNSCTAFSKDICRAGSVCKTDANGHHHCKDPCIENDKPICGKHGKCHVDLMFNTICRSDNILDHFGF